ncbi:hypothetical protein BOTNAR_0140g00070 [Botryotinia narcissicola]|uniref:Uncharacterized protein n=1 Tax=Botryotinia narcissicola TaxID=278944 RepID=A0A4Z1IHA8_9HELO|nr:hypothetical protein BOTNAR_0140g00070 [Botryotinia narcissicola]
MQRAIFSFNDILNFHVTIHGNRASTKSATILKTRWETHPPPVLISGFTTVSGPIHKDFEDEENVEDDEGGYAN